ncbi:MAG TPA: hypothetical protein VGY54_08475 [Polyangiaceae bacterium]|nr:hypothetical protein [Polyangiaceae bacterium]
MISRRDLVRQRMVSGTALSFWRVVLADEAEFIARETLPGLERFNPAESRAGIALNAPDFRAADLPGWPTKASYALLIQATDATHAYVRLTGGLKPLIVATAEDLARVGTRVPEFYSGVLCPVGITPLHLGHRRFAHRRRPPRQGDPMRLHQPLDERGAEDLASRPCAAPDLASGCKFRARRRSGQYDLAPRASRDGLGSKMLGEICAQIKEPPRNGSRSLEAIVEHIGTDHGRPEPK